VIAFCGVHFMAETASVLSPEKTVLIPDLDAGCSLADSIAPDQLRAWQAEHPGAVTVMYVNTTAEIKALTDYCVTSSNAVAVVEHILREHGADTEILFGPDMFLGAYVEKTIGRALHVWDGECHVHAGIRPSDIERTRAAHPGADFLIHPECGCSTSVMEYVAAGDVDPEGVHMLSTGGMLGYAATARPGTTAIMATETGMLHPLRMAAPDVDFIAANEEASCRFMKMITLPKLRDALRDGVFEVKVPEAIAERARVPIERMVAIG
jgi:quinolinate synthase